MVKMKFSLFITVACLLHVIIQWKIEASRLPINGDYKSLRKYGEWRNNEAIQPHPLLQQPEIVYNTQESYRAHENERSNTIVGTLNGDDYLSYEDSDSGGAGNLNDFEYVEDLDVEEFENPLSRKSSSHMKKKYAFTARVFNINFTTSLDKALEINGKQIEISNKITIPNASSAGLEYKCNVKQSREQFYEMTFSNTLTQFRRVFFEFTPPFFSHWENYEEPKSDRNRRFHAVNVKEYEIEASVTVPAHTCVEVSFLLDWIENFRTRFNSVMEISGVVLKSSKNGHVVQIPLSPGTIETILKNRGITFMKPRKDEFIATNADSLYVRLSGELRATFGATAYLSSVDIPCQTFKKSDKVVSHTSGHLH